MHARPLNVMRNTHGEESECIVDFNGAMQRLHGDRELFAELVEIFVEDSPVMLESIRRSAETGDAACMARDAHNLKGLMANFGARDAVAAAWRLEQLGHLGSLEEAAEAIAGLEREVGKLDRALQPYRTR